MRYIAIALLCASCSIALQAKPPRRDCTTAPMLAVIDTIIAVGAGAAVVYGAVRMDDTGNLIAGTSGIGGILFLASAGNGYRWANECQRGAH